MHPTGFFFAIILLFMVVPPALWCAVVGLRALWLARRHTGPAVLSLVIIAITLWEPLVNIPIIASHLLTQGSSRAAWDSEILLKHLRITATMAVVLLPAVGLFVREPLSRRALCQLLRLGVLRWLTVFAALYYATFPADAPNALPFLLSVFGTILLYVTAGWAGHVVGRTFAQPHLPWSRRWFHWRGLLVCALGISLGVAGIRPLLQPEAASWSIQTRTYQTYTGEKDATTESMAFSPDETLLAISADRGEGGVQLWRMADQRLLYTFHGMAYAHTLAFSPDSRLLALAAQQRIILVSPKTGTTVQTFTLPRPRQRLNDNGKSQVVFSPDGTLLVSISNADSYIYMWEVATGLLVASLDGAVKVTAIAVSPDGQYVAAGRHDGRLMLWRLADHSHVWTSWTHRRVSSLAFTPDGQSLVSGGRDGRMFVPWESKGSLAITRVVDGVKVRSWVADRFGIDLIAIRPDGKVIATHGRMGTRLWMTDGGPDHVRIQGGNLVVWSASGRYLAVGDGSHDARFKVLSITTSPIEPAASTFPIGNVLAHHLDHRVSFSGGRQW